MHRGNHIGMLLIGIIAIVALIVAWIALGRTGDNLDQRITDAVKAALEDQREADGSFEP